MIDPRLDLLQLGHALTRVETTEVALIAASLRRLQLGHALTRVETAKSISDAGWSTFTLQLGHALTRVETRAAEAKSQLEVAASIGPRTHARGNALENELINGDSTASIGPRTHARGNLNHSACCSAVLLSFNWA